MYWLKLPKYICNETDSLDMNFLWCKNKKEEKNLHSYSNYSLDRKVKGLLELER